MILQNRPAYHWLLLIIPFISSLGCSYLEPQKLSTIQALASENKFKYRKIHTPSFSLLSFVKETSLNPIKDIHLYIEGDGYAWSTSRRPSSDPTPKNSLVFQLAIADPADTVIYLARPCQYLLTSNQEDCHSNLWTSHRYSKKVLLSMDSAVSTLVSNYDSNYKLHIIGYSGGGTIATLLSSQRQDIHRLTTVSANLDHTAWTVFHHDSPLFGSLNSVDIAKNIAHIPQVHFFGKEDTIVPFSTTQNFFDQLPNQHNTHIQLINLFDHSCCWVKEWKNLLSSLPNY